MTGRRPCLTAFIALATMLVAGLLAVRSDERREVVAVFDSAHGLVAGARVVSDGVAVGQVADLRIGSDGLPRVRLRLDGGVRLREGARATLRMRSNSGELNRVVEVSAGRGAPLADGAVIPAGRTSAPVEIDDVLGTLEPRMRADVRGVLAGLDGATAGLAPAFERGLRHSATALAEASSLLRGVTQDGHALRELVVHGRTSAAALARNRAALGGTVGELASLLDAAARRDGELRATVRALPAGLREPRRALEALGAAVPDLRRAVRAAAAPARELQPTAAELAPALREATPALRDLDATLRGAPPGLTALRPLLRAARPLAARLGPALRDGGHALDVLRTYAPELMGFLSGWSGAASSYDAAGHGVRLLPSQAPIPTTTVPSGSRGPGYLASPFLREPGALVGQPWTDHRASRLSPERP